MVELGWKSIGVLELTALPGIDPERWLPMVRGIDALLVNGGDALYLCHWMRRSGLADLFAEQTDTVYVGLSAGSMVMTPRIGAPFVSWRPPEGRLVVAGEPFDDLIQLGTGPSLALQLGHVEGVERGERGREDLAHGPAR